MITFFGLEKMVEEGNYSVFELADLCQEETRQFRLRRKTESLYCFELFRLAFAEKRNEAFSAIFSVYGRMVQTWVYRHSMFPLLNNMPAEYIAADATSNFIFALLEIPFDRFDSVAAVLQYWKMCVDSTIKGEYRKQQRQVFETPLDDARIYAAPGRFDEQLSAAQIWQRIESLLDEDDRLLARYIYVQDLMPRQIVKLTGIKWKSTNEVRVAAQRIKRRLQGDPQIRLMLGIEPDLPAKDNP